MEILTKICTCCHQEKPLSEFYNDKRIKKDGKTACCKACLDAKNILYRQTHKKERSEYECNQRATNSAWREAQAERAKKFLAKLKLEGGERLEKYKSKQKARNKLIRTKDPRYSLWHGARARAREKGLEFNIDLEDIVLPEKCPILEIPICQNDGKAKFNSYSLDRIDPSKGYIKGNIGVISRMANTMKNDASKEELEIFCKNILNYINRKDIVRTTENEESVELENKESLG